jgi:hypothetical protein
MVQIYNEITIYFYKEIFASGASPPNPHWGMLPPNPRWGPACPQTPHPGGWPPRTPQRGYPPSALPRVEECTYFWGVNTSWGIDTAESKGPMHQEDNQAPQPTLEVLCRKSPVHEYLYFYCIILLVCYCSLLLSLSGLCPYVTLCLISRCQSLPYPTLASLMELAIVLRTLLLLHGQFTPLQIVMTLDYKL